MTSWIRPCDVQREGVCGSYVSPIVWVFLNKDESHRREPRPVHASVIDAVDELCEACGIPRQDTVALLRTFDTGAPLGAESLVQMFSYGGPYKSW